MIGFLAVAMAARRVVQCYRARDWEPARGNALLFSWLAAGVAVFGYSALKFPQYFALVLIPAYCLFWTEVARWDWRFASKAAVAGVVTVLSAGLFLPTMPSYGYNTLAAAQHYAAA